MLNKIFWSATAVSLWFLILTGCATRANFDHTPTDEKEFVKSISELKHSYSDIEKYDRFFSSTSDSPPLDELEKQWGKPLIQIKWWKYAFFLSAEIGLTVVGLFSYPLLPVLFLFEPLPQEEYIWQKGNYEITAQSRKDIFVGYEKRIHNWDWMEKPNSERVVYDLTQDQ